MLNQTNRHQMDISQLKFHTQRRELEIVYINSAILYAELNRKSNQDVLMPFSLATSYYVSDEFPRMIEQEVSLELAILASYEIAPNGHARLTFENGRHRTAALVELGMTVVPVSMTAETKLFWKELEREFWRRDLPENNSLRERLLRLIQRF